MKFEYNLVPSSDPVTIFLDGSVAGIAVVNNTQYTLYVSQGSNAPNSRLFDYRINPFEFRIFPSPSSNFSLAFDVENLAFISSVLSANIIVYGEGEVPAFMSYNKLFPLVPKRRVLENYNLAVTGGGSTGSASGNTVPDNEIWVLDTVAIDCDQSLTLSNLDFYYKKSGYDDRYLFKTKIESYTFVKPDIVIEPGWTSEVFLWNREFPSITINVVIYLNYSVYSI